jgi:hypothetical protein
MNYKIIAFDQATAQITIRVENLQPTVIDLPIDEEGNLPTGPLLDQYLRGFIPTWYFDRQQKLAAGVANADAIAALVEPEAPIQPTTEQISVVARASRDLLLKETDWTQLADAALDQLEKAAWAAYRQELRDVPQQNDFPNNIVWPISPNEEPR